MHEKQLKDKLMMNITLNNPVISIFSLVDQQNEEKPTKKLEIYSK